MKGGSWCIWASWTRYLPWRALQIAHGLYQAQAYLPHAALEKFTEENNQHAHHPYLVLISLGSLPHFMVLQKVPDEPNLACICHGVAAPSIAGGQLAGSSFHARKAFEQQQVPSPLCSCEQPLDNTKDLLRASPQVQLPLRFLSPNHSAYSLGQQYPN